MLTTLYINDNNLLLQQGTKLVNARGYARFSGGDVEFDQAINQCRLDPQKINNRYWQQCDQSAISQNDAGMRHAGDLIWKQLSGLKKELAITELALIVPSHYQTGNLQLLLGICQSLDIVVKGLVNKSVMMLTPAIKTDGEYLHIDLQLNQTVCSSTRSLEGQLNLSGVEVLHEVSMQAIQDALLRAMQERFIQADRFDPLHHAETEQQLFDQIPTAAAAIENEGKANLLINYQGKLHTVSMDRKQWQVALQPFAEKMRDIGSTSSVSHVFLQANNLFSGADVWRLNSDHFTILSEQAIPSPEHIPLNADVSEELTYTTVAPLLAQEPTQESVTTTESDVQSEPVVSPTSVAGQVEPRNLSQIAAGQASHLLCAGLAIPVESAHIMTNDNQLNISSEGTANALEMLQSGQLFVINDPQRAELQVNDRLGSNLADGLITVIQVRE